MPKSERGFPDVVSSITKYRPTGCDETTSMILTFPPNQAHGIATTGIKVSFQNHHRLRTISNTRSLKVGTTPNASIDTPPPVRIQGTHGDLIINDSPFRPNSYTLIPATSQSRGTPATFKHETVTKSTPGRGHGMFWEADECARCIRDGKLESESTPLDESLVIMKVMDEVRKQGALVYPGSLETTEYP